MSLSAAEKYEINKVLVEKFGAAELGIIANVSPWTSKDHSNSNHKIWMAKFKVVWSEIPEKYTKKLDAEDLLSHLQSNYYMRFRTVKESIFGMCNHIHNNYISDMHGKAVKVVKTEEGKTVVPNFAGAQIELF